MLGFFEGFGMYWTRYFDFKSRSQRSEFWWSFVGLTILTGIIAGITNINDRIGKMVYLIFTIVTFIPNLSQYARRFRDIGINPKWIILTYGLPLLLVEVINYLPWYIQLLDILLVLVDMGLSALPSKD
ncbi:DUF805 domain-containing protein [Apilactobacillus apinorum]|uniref:DUF805 domain-containing protein n=2 Tax=Apilactobacillus apinorum TaxID=1218495 RepID=UPI0006B5F6E0|nr:DUF805 domain-containing protein [Apilactobacillus apinorum]KOY68263.1 hypothetical protein RZ74_11960 [Apilactobacillus apinorum]CAI2692111.1 Hypothetical protein AAPFHON13_12940 [Apilactobacillus apinorum]